MEEIKFFSVKYFEARHTCSSFLCDTGKQLFFLAIFIFDSILTFITFHGTNFCTILYK